VALWGEDVPAAAVKTVQVHVSRLRRALGDPEAVSTPPAGDRLRVRTGALDAESFARGVERGHVSSPSALDGVSSEMTVLRRLSGTPARA
jgi:DNA-binding SARP family transcriptional activator